MNLNEFLSKYHQELTEYVNNLSENCKAEAKKLGILIITPYSDDNIELDGVTSEEISAYNGVSFSLDSDLDLIKNECSCGNDCPYFEDYITKNAEIGITYGKDLPWSISCDPNPDFEILKFEIQEDGELYGEGLLIKKAGN